jgi:hypothetical protein
MSKFQGLNQFCMVDKDSKNGGCKDMNNNIHTTCKQEKVFVSTDKNDKTSTPSSASNNIMVNGVRDTSIDYNYFRSSRAQ